MFEKKNLEIEMIEKSVEAMKAAMIINIFTVIIRCIQYLVTIFTFGKCTEADIFDNILRDDFQLKLIQF